MCSKIDKAKTPAELSKLDEGVKKSSGEGTLVKENRWELEAKIKNKQIK